MTTSHRTTTEPGFTLVELLLVLALAVMIAAMAAPSLTGTLDNIRLDGAAEQVRDAWADARLRAIRTGEPIAFQCQLGTSQYCVSTLNGAANAIAGADPTTENEDLSAEVTFQQVSIGAPDDPLVDPTVPACMVFRPDGAADDAFAIVRAADGRTRTITLRGLTGSATIDDGLDTTGEP